MTTPKQVIFGVSSFMKTAKGMSHFSLDTLKLAEKYISLAEKYQQNEKKTDYDLLNGNNGIFDDPNEGNCNSLQRTLMELSGARTLVPEHMKSLEKILSGFSHIMGAQYFE